MKLSDSLKSKLTETLADLETGVQTGIVMTDQLKDKSASSLIGFAVGVNAATTEILIRKAINKFKK